MQNDIKYIIALQKMMHRSYHNAKKEFKSVSHSRVGNALWQYLFWCLQNVSVLGNHIHISSTS